MKIHASKLMTNAKPEHMVCLDTYNQPELLDRRLKEKTPIQKLRQTP